MHEHTSGQAHPQHTPAQMMQRLLGQFVTCFCKWMRRLKKEGRMWRCPLVKR